MTNIEMDQEERRLRNKYKAPFYFLNKDEWVNSIPSNGEPIQLWVPYTCLGDIRGNPRIVASGITNKYPGFDVLREDHKEFRLKGQLYNMDHYEVYEDLSKCQYISFDTALLKTLVLVKKLKGNEYLNHKPTYEIVEQVKNTKRL
jgi:hypothetical protein